ncbi:MAG: hypothetical protein ACREGR_00870 [Minisyncoccia bacterium]
MNDLKEHALSPDELVIDENNFGEYFFDVRQNKPKPGQVLAVYAAMAELVEGKLKEDLVYLLTQCKGGGESASRVMRKLGGASEKDSFRVPREMAEDMLNGLSPADVMAKPYKYRAEFHFYTKPEYIPRNDPHWSSVVLKNLDEFCTEVEDKSGQKFEVKARILTQEEVEASKKEQVDAS